MTPWLDPIGALAAFVLLLALAVASVDALLGVGLGACLMGVTRAFRPRPNAPAERGR
jgi:hypothetical protein